MADDTSPVGSAPADDKQPAESSPADDNPHPESAPADHGPPGDSVQAGDPAILESEGGESSPAAAAVKKKKRKEKKKEKTGSARGIETMFRTSYRTHLDLSALADNKANIMISINGIIMSILLASIYPRILENRFLLLPTAVLLVFCLLSLVYAVLAARPRVTRREATLEEVRGGKANILFFGTFTSMQEEDFLEGMLDIVHDPEKAYGNMIRDIYGLGSVLETKYRLLRTSYTTFMVGLILGVALFLIAFTWGSGTSGGF